MKTKKKAEHTPIPWELHESPNDYEGKIIQSNNRVVAVTHMQDEVKESNEEKANAAFIIRAVNSHEELLGTLRGAMAALILTLPYVGHPLSGESRTVNNAIKDIRSIIAKAEEK